MWKSNSLPPVIILFLKKFLWRACVCTPVAHVPGSCPGGIPTGAPSPAGTVGQEKSPKSFLRVHLKQNHLEKCGKALEGSPLLGERAALCQQPYSAPTSRHSLALPGPILG